MHIKYQFKFPDLNEETINYELTVNDKTFMLEEFNNIEESDTDWAKLDFNKCSNCNLSPKDNIYCPIAKNLHSVVLYFKDLPSCKENITFVETKERTYAKKGMVQEGLFSIFGIIMATSGCIHMNFLAPMVKMHLPFATYEETFVRTASMYLLKQYLLKNKLLTDEPLSLKGLIEKYTEVKIVNEGILNRIKNIAQKDADKNALIILKNFTQIIKLELYSKNHETLTQFFGI